MCLVGTYFYTNVKFKKSGSGRLSSQHVIGMVLVPVNQFKFMLPASGCLNLLISRNISDILKREKEIYKNDC